MKAFKITILSLLIIIITLLMIIIMNKDININFKFLNKSKLLLDESYSNENIKKVDITTKSTDIKIIKSDDNDFHVKIYTYKNNEVSSVVDNNNLNISVKGNHSCIGICFTNNNVIELYVPSKYEGDFTINGTSADVLSEIDNINSYNITLTSGDIKLNNVNNLSGTSTSGDIFVKNISSSIAYQLTSGDIKIDDLSINNNSSIKVTSGDIFIEKINDVYIDANTTSGDAKISKNNRFADYELKLSSTSGDIFVK